MLVVAVVSGYGQLGNTCGNAVHICNLYPFSRPGGAYGAASFQPQCFTYNGTSNTWYQFTPATSGTLAWSCTPTAANTELDWAVYDVTNGCANLVGNELACNAHNAAAVSAPIGMSSASGTVCPINSTGGAISAEFCPSITVTAGRTYAIFINNQSNNQSGWDFNWAGSTFTLTPPAITVSAGGSRTMCINQTITLNGTVNPSGAYTYQWSPLYNITNSNSLSPLVSPVVDTTYVLQVADATGCAAADSARVTMNGVSLPVNASVTPALVCPGQLVQLDANILPSVCGVTSPCIGGTTSSVVGGGNTSQPGGGTSTPTLMGNFNKSGRNQMLYLASELTTALGGPCTIKTLSFDLSPYNSNAQLDNFTISVACTNTTSLTTWENNLTVVYNSAGYQPVLNWNNFNLTNVFNWDGVSNLVVEICWYNASTFANQNNKAVCTTTAFTSYLNYYANFDVCGTTNAPTTSTLRPNIRFNYCVPDINNYNIVWTPSTGPNQVSNPSIARPTSNPVANTSYTVVVGTGACSGSRTVSVQVDTSTVSAGNDVNACPTTITTLTATVRGVPNPGPATFVWTTLAGVVVGNTQSVNVNPSVTTTYVVTMNGGACPKRDTITIFVGSLNVVPTVTNISCNGGTNGQISVTANGVPAYTYQWSLNANNGNVNPAINLAQGNYSVTVTDANGCSGSVTASVTQPTAYTISQTHTDVTCFSGNNGTITITPNGGTGVSTYSWSNSLPATNTQSNLTANTYTVTAHDANNCSMSLSVTIAQPTQITFGTATVQNVACFGGNTGSITVAPSGGNPGGYTYSWSQNAGLNSPTATGLTAAGSPYTVTVKDVNLCSGTVTYSITQPASALSLPTPTPVNVSCPGGSNGTATAVPSGGTTPYSYLWSPGAQNTATITGLTAQTYTVTVTDDSLCTASAAINITQPAPINITGTVTNVDCNGNATGGVVTNITNGAPPLSPQWSNQSANANLSNVTAGTYTVTVTDANSCTGSASFTITEPTPFVLNPATITNVSCLGASNGSITANPSGGVTPYRFQWSVPGTTATISNLPQGTYALTVTDLNNCVVTATYNITQPPTGITFLPPQIVDELCHGGNTGSITVNVSGGTGNRTYQWSHNATLGLPTASQLIAGAYTVTVSDANGCSITNTYTVNEPAAIIFATPTVTDVSCGGGSDGTAQVNPSGGTPGYTYAWNGAPGTNPKTGLAAGTYNVVVTDANNCTASTAVTINQPASLSSYTTSTDVKCHAGADGTMTMNVNGGNQPYKYSWSDPGHQVSQTATGLVAGTYYCTVTDNTGCSTSASGSITDPSEFKFTPSSTQVKCAGDQNGTISISGNGGTPPYTFSVTQDQANFVHQDPVTLAAEGLAAGLYLVIANDNNGCTKTDTISVASPVADSIIITTDSTSCFGPQYTDGAIHITGLTAQNMPYQYSVDSGLYQYSGDFYGLGAGLHSLVAQNNFGCLTYWQAVIGTPVEGFVSVLPKDTTLQLGESIQLSSSFYPYPTSAITNYNWSPAIALNCIDCPDPVAFPYNRQNQYVLTVTYNKGCIATDSLTIVVLNNLKVYIPNSFSPNGDGNNDVFLIYGEAIKTIDLKVFNRWGELIFKTENQFQGWDGTYKGEMQNPGVYVYDAKITFLDDKTNQRAGSITLIR